MATHPENASRRPPLKLLLEAAATTPYHFMNQDELSFGPSNAPSRKRHASRYGSWALPSPTTRSSMWLWKCQQWALNGASTWSVLS